jgi:3-phytase
MTLIFSGFLLSCASTSSKEASQMKIQIFRLESPPLLGKTKAGQDIYLGGFSGLHFVKKENDKFFFMSITDRGPNAEELENNKGVKVRPFLLPDFSPQLIEFNADVLSSLLNVDANRPFLGTDAKGLTGFPPSAKLVGKDKKIESPSDIYGKNLKDIKAGIDPEGFCVFRHTYLISDEYGPDLLQFDYNLKLINRWSPTNGLPPDFALRKTNRGIEGLACDANYAYLFLQSPLKKTEKELDQEHVRLAQFNPLTGKTEKEFYYPVNGKEADKIGDLTIVRENVFLVIEQNGKIGPEGYRKLFRIDLSKVDSQNRLTKELIVDLNTLKFDFPEKIEGITVIDPSTVAIVIDNDFGLAGPIDLKTGEVTFSKDPHTYLGIIHLDKAL